MCGWYAFDMAEHGEQLVDAVKLGWVCSPRVALPIPPRKLAK
jgi:hypothetical protein